MKKYLILTYLMLSMSLFAIAQVTKKPAKLTQCIEKESKPNKNGDVTYTRICTYDNYRSIAIGEPDEMGRLNWASTLYIKGKNGRFVKTNNAAFFNAKSNDLLVLLNTLFNKGFIKDKKAITDTTELRDCFGNKVKLDTYSWNDITIELKDSCLVFTISYRLGMACRPFDQGETVLTLKRLKPYLRP